MQELEWLPLLRTYMYAAQAICIGSDFSYQSKQLFGSVSHANSLYGMHIQVLVHHRQQRQYQKHYLLALGEQCSDLPDRNQTAI